MVLKILSNIFFAITVVTGIKNFRTIQKLKDQGQDILATKTAQGGKIPIIYGRRRVGSTLLYMDTDSGNSKELFVIYGLCLGEVDSIELDTIEINGVPLSDTKVFRDGYYTGSDKISSGAGSLNTASQIGTSSGSFRGDGRSGTDPTKIYRMVLNAHHGADDQAADPMLVASQPAKFGSNHRLRGIAYLACSFQYDQKGMFTSVPELTVVVKGRKLYDPRLDGSITGGTGSHRIDDPTTYEWSNNAALTLLDYMHQDYGKGLATSSIDLQSFQTAANTADTIVDVPDYSGSYASATFSADVEDNFITVNEATWKKIKGGELLSVKDSGGSVIINQNNVIDAQRFTPHTESTNFRIYIDGVPPAKVSKSVTFAATNGDATITVSCTSHGASVNDRVLFSGATSLGGNITATVLNKGYTIATVVDANSFTIEATNLNLTTVLANSSDTGNGGAGAVGKFMYADESGSVLTQTRRLQCDGVLDTNETVLDNARDLLSNMRGFLNYIDGKYSVLVEDATSSSFSITDDHIIDEGIKIRYEDKAEKLNKVVVQFFNAQKKYESDTKTVFHNNSTSTYKNDDGGEELETTAEFQYITNPYNAFNMGKGILERSRRQKTISFIGTPRLLNLTPGDVVTITYTPYNLSNAAYRIETINLLDNGLVGIQAIEYFDFYTWSSTPPEENVGADPDLPTGTEAEPPTNLTFTDATSTRRAFLTWTAATNYPAKEFRVIIKNSSGQEIHNRIVSDAFIDLDFIAVANGYVASITSISSTGAESSATSITFNVTQQPVKLGDIQANAITANEINVTNLAAIKSDLGDIDAGSINIGSGAFIVTSAGALTATNATVTGNITASSLNVTGATVTGTIDASKITLNGDPLTDIFALAGSGQSQTLSLGPDNKNLLKVDGIQLKYFAFDQVQNQGTEVLQMDMDTLELFNTRFDHTQITFTSSGSIAAATLSATTSLTLGAGSAPSTTTNKLYNVGGSLFFNGSQLGTGTGDITAVVAGTNLNGGGTTGSVTLNLDSTITGNHTFSNNLIVGGDLTVQGTTTTIDTTNLDVKDKNITLNYSTGDSSGNANGAGITIQDAVDASTDATILWDATNDEFDFSHGITLPDNQKLQFGASNDLKIDHNSSTGVSRIIDDSGILNIQQSGDDGIIRFQSDDGSGGVTTYYSVNGQFEINQFFKDTKHGDNVKALFGTSNDLQIYHDGSNSYIKDAGTGDLRIWANSPNIATASGNKIFFGNNGAAELYFTGGAKRLETTSSGVSVTGGLDVGTVTSTGNLVLNQDSGTIFIGADLDMRILHDGSNGTFRNDTGDLTVDVAGGIVFDADDSGTISFKDGGTRYGLVQKATNDFEIKSMIDDGDILFKGLDNSSTITALTLDMSNAGAATFNSTISGGQINATTSSDATAAIIATNTGGVSSIIQRWVGDSDALDVRCIDTGDYQISNSQQTNGIDFYDGTGGLAFRYNNAVVAQINSTGGFDLVTGAYKINNSIVIDSSRQIQNITGIGATTSNTATGGGIGFKFVANDAVVDSAFSGILLDHNVSGSDTATADRAHIAFNIDQDSTASGGDTSNEHRLYGISVSSKATGDSDLIRAGNFSGIADQDSGTVTNVYGVFGTGKAQGEALTSNVHGSFFQAQKTNGGDTTNIFGAYAKSNILAANTGSVTNAYGLYGEIELDSNTTITNAYGVRSIIDRDDGTITNGYLFHGLYQGTQPTNAYGVYISSDVPNYFAGTINSGAIDTNTIGTTSAADFDLRANNQTVVKIRGQSNSDQYKVTFNSNITIPATVPSSKGGKALRFPVDADVSGTTELEFFTPLSSPASTLSVSNTLTAGAIDIPSNGTNDTRIEIGTSPLANHNAYVDLVGDTTYTDYGLRLIRYNSGANTNSQLVHRGTGSLFIEAQDAGNVILKSNGSDGLTINSSQNAVFGGVVGIGGTSTNSNYGIWLQNNKWYATQYSSSHDVVRMNANTAGGLDIYNQTDSAFAVIRTGGVNIGSTQVIDGSRNLTNIGTVSCGAITSSGNMLVTANSSSNHSLEVKRASDGSQALRINATGEVVVSNNYLYASNSGTSFYSEGDAVFRATIRNDQSGMPVKVSDDFNVTGAYQSNGTTIIDSSRVLQNVTFTNSILPTELKNNHLMAGSNAILRMQETDVTNSPTWWTVADGGTWSVRLNNTGTYPISIATNSDNNAVSQINIGYNTIFAGEITSSATIQSNNGSIVSHSTGEAQVKLISTAGVDNTSYVFNSDTGFGAYNGTDAHFYWFYDRSASNFNVYAGNSLITRANSSGLQVHTGGYYIAGTEIITSSRNLTNIGTIACTNITCGNVTPSGEIFLGNAKEINFAKADGSNDGTKIERFSGNALRFRYTGNSCIFDSLGNNPFSIRNSNDSVIFEVSPNSTHANSTTNINNGVLQIAGTTVINGSRNLVNIGTISSGAITSSGDITAFSDERLKDNIQTLDGKKALQMRGVSFIRDGKEGSGVIAQEIEKIAPELVATADDEQGTKSVAYGNLVGYLIEAIKEQQDQIEYMKSEIKTLKEANNGNK